MSKHTPGPWTVTHNNWEVSSVYDAKGVVIAEILIDGDVTEDTQDVLEPIKDANANLIAAAPDLLDALALIEMESRDGGQWTMADINEVARAALAKARGES